MDEFGNTQYLTDVSGTFSITDEEGNTRESFTEENLGFLGAETSETQVSQMSLVFTYTPGFLPELNAGTYKMTFTVTNNLSGQRVNVVKDIIIRGGGGQGGIEGGMGGGAGGVTGTTTPPGEGGGQPSSTPSTFGPSEPTVNATTTEGLSSPTSNQSLQKFSTYSSPSLGIVTFLYNPMTLQ